MQILNEAPLEYKVTRSVQNSKQWRCTILLCHLNSAAVVTDSNWRSIYFIHNHHGQEKHLTASKSSTHHNTQHTSSTSGQEEPVPQSNWRGLHYVPSTLVKQPSWRPKVFFAMRTCTKAISSQVSWPLVAITSYISTWLWCKHNTQVDTAFIAILIYKITGRL